MRGVMARSRVARRVVMGSMNALQLRLLAGHKSPDAMAALRRMRVGCEPLLSADESFVLHAIGAAQSALDGAFAEFGVYEGASARLLCEVKGERPLHLFDTFAGLPTPGASEARVFSAGQFDCRLDAVKRTVGPSPNVHFHPGLFPASAAAASGLRFSFVHLDVDLEDSTRDGLAFFYERTVPGGIILAHDYSIIPGVSRAIDGFLRDKPERVIELPTTQAMIIRSPDAARMAA